MTPRDAHPDEGTIHTWLDGELDAAAALDLEVHVAGCADCRARVAEARGLIAGASRVVHALDDAPLGAAPRAWGESPAPPSRVATDGPLAGAVRGTKGRFLRVTPARAAIAATLLIAAGLTITRVRTVPEPKPPVDASRESEIATAPKADTTEAAPAPVSGAAPVRDGLLDSAIARNLATAQPHRTVRPAPGPSIPQPTPAPPARVDTVAETRVAVARAAVRAQRDTVGGVADRARVGAVASPADATPLERTIAAAKAAERTVGASAGGRGAAAAAAPSVASATTGPTECYRVESATGAPASWGAVPLPFVIALDAAPAIARILGPTGAATDSRAVRAGGTSDSLLLSLRRSGYEGTLALGTPGEARAGVMRSHPTAAGVEQAIDSAASAERRVGARRRLPASPAPRAENRNAAGPPAADALAAAPAVPIVARRMACPGQQGTVPPPR
jgi:hypothetical protein